MSARDEMALWLYSEAVGGGVFIEAEFEYGRDHPGAPDRFRVAQAYKRADALIESGVPHDGRMWEGRDVRYPHLPS